MVIATKEQVQGKRRANHDSRSS